MMMVIGDGIIANRFIDYSLQSEHLIYAGNLHDSAIQDENVIHAEEVLVSDALAKNSNATFVYISSCHVLDSNMSQTPYVQHKKRMEHRRLQSVVSKL